MQKLCFLLNYSSRLGSSWSTTKVSLTTPSRVERQVDIDVASRRSGRSKACGHHAKHAIGAGFRPDTRSRRCAQCASKNKLSDFVSQRHPPPNGIEGVWGRDSAAKLRQRPPARCGLFRGCSVCGISWSQHPASPLEAHQTRQPPDATRLSVYRNARTNAQTAGDHPKYGIQPT